jgi:hypothetical protein
MRGFETGLDEGYIFGHRLLGDDGAEAPRQPDWLDGDSSTNAREWVHYLDEKQVAAIVAQHDFPDRQLLTKNRMSFEVGGPCRVPLAQPTPALDAHALGPDANPCRQVSQLRLHRNEDADDAGAERGERRVLFCGLSGLDAGAVEFVEQHFCPARVPEHGPHPQLPELPCPLGHNSPAMSRMRMIVSTIRTDCASGLMLPLRDRQPISVGTRSTA